MKSIRLFPLPRWLLLAFILSIFAITAFGAGRYLRAVANPVLTADSWFFLDVFVSKQADGTLGWQDYFAKREMSDHSQPLHKLVLAANTRWFGLDFMVDALSGFAGMLVCAVALLWRSMRAFAGKCFNFADAALVALIPTCLFSLNGLEIYTWPLVTQFYLVLPFSLLLFFSIGSGSARASWYVFFSSFTALIMLDGGGLLAATAAFAALMFAPIFGKFWSAEQRTEILRLLPKFAALVAAVLLYKLLYWWLLPQPISGNGSVIAGLMQMLSTPRLWWQCLVIPAAASVVHKDNLDYFFPDAGGQAAIALGALVLSLHVMFWLSQYRRRLENNTLALFTRALMLYVYAMIIGIIVARVADMGVNYLWQSRYVAFYQLANIALLMQWLAARASHAVASGSEGKKARFDFATIPVALILVGVISLQRAIIEVSWNRAPFIQSYFHQLADSIYCLQTHPAIDKPVCLPNHSVCGWDMQTRNRLVRLLSDQKLNVFSPRFQARYHYAPDAKQANVCVKPN